MVKRGIDISTNQEALRQVIKKEHLTQKEADQIILGLDKKLFLENLLGRLKYKHLMPEREIEALFKQLPSASKELGIPVSLFNNQTLSALESLCRYLKDQKGLKYSEIALLLNRDQRTIWVTYHNSLKKSAAAPDVSDTRYNIPLNAFQDRNLSVLESIVRHLKDTHHLRYSEIAVLLGRDERNIWGMYNRAGRKPNA